MNQRGAGSGSRLLVVFLAALFAAVGGASALQVTINSPPDAQWTTSSTATVAGTVSGLGASVLVLDSDLDFAAGTPVNATITGGSVVQSVPSSESYRYRQDFTGLTGATRIDRHWLWHLTDMAWSVSALAGASSTPPSVYHASSTLEKIYWSTFLPGALTNGSLSLRYWCDTNGLLGVYVSPDGRQATEQTVATATGATPQTATTFTFPAAFSGVKSLYVRIIAGGSSATSNGCSIDDFDFEVTYAPDGASARVEFLDDFSQGATTPWDWSDTWWGWADSGDYRGSDTPPSALHGGKAMTSEYANWATVSPIQTAQISFTYKGESNARILFYLSKDGISETNILTSAYGPSHTFFTYNATSILAGGQAVYLRVYADATQDLYSLSGFDNFNLTLVTAGAVGPTLFYSNYTTPVEDLQVPANLTAVAWTSTVPPGNSINVSVRASSDGGNFTPWMAVATSGTSPIAAGYRYFQVGVDFTAAINSGGNSLNSISLTYRGIAALEWTTDGVTWRAKTPSATWSASVPLSGGSNNITVRARDTTGNYASATVNVLRDTFPPSAPGKPAGPAITKQATGTWSWTPASDTGVGVVGYLVDAGTTPDGTDLADAASVPGTNFSLSSLPDLASVFVRVRAVDAAGLVSQYSVLSEPTVVDRTAPGAGAFLAPGNYSNSNGLDFAWSEPADLGSWVSYYIVHVGTASGAADVASATSASPLYSISSTTSGSRYFASVTAVDAAGNAGPEFVSNGTLVDRDLPSIPGTVTGPPEWTNASVLSWSWGASSETGSGLASYHVRIGSTQGAADVVTTSTAGLTFDFADAVDGGTYFLSVSGVDRVGNEGTARQAAAVHVDRSAPMAPAIAPIPDFVAGARHRVSWTAPLDLPAVGGSGTTRYAITVLAGSTAQTISQIPTELEVQLTDGVSYTVTIAAIDGAGNTGPAAAAHFVADLSGPSAPPGITLTPPAAGSVIVTASWTASSDAGSGVREYRVSIGTTPGGDELIRESAVNGTSFEWTGVPGQTYYLTVWAVDKLGNEGTHATSEPVTVPKPLSLSADNSNWLILVLALAAAGVALFVYARKRQKPQ